MTCRLLSVAIRSNFGIIGSDEGLTLETSVFLGFYQITLQLTMVFSEVHEEKIGLKIMKLRD